MTTVLIALIAAVVGPTMLFLFSRSERRENWRRQDEVAARVREAAQALVHSNNTVNGKLDTIHLLVNSTLTAAKEAELAALKQSLVLQRAELQRSPGDELAAMITATIEKISVLEAEIVERSMQQAVIDQAELTPESYKSKNQPVPVKIEGTMIQPPK